MEPNSDIKLYDPRAALNRIRGRNDKLAQSVSERNGLQYYTPTRENQPQIPRKGISSKNTYGGNVASPSSEKYAPRPDIRQSAEENYERKISVLEEENRSLSSLNSELRRENEGFKREKEEWATRTQIMKDKYESEVSRLKDQITFMEEKYRKVADMQKKLTEPSSSKQGKDSIELPFKVTGCVYVDRSLHLECRPIRRDIPRKGFAI